MPGNRHGGSNPSLSANLRASDAGARYGWLANLLPLAAAIVGFTATLAVFYPGYMSPDSISQLAQGRRGLYSDWHPPVMAWLWGGIDRIVAGPAGMLVLHNVLFWGSLTTLACMRFLRRRWAAAAVLLIGFFPPIFALLGTIWKDVAHGVTMLTAFVLLLHAHRRQSTPAVGVAAVLMLYAVAVRHNAAPAIAPFALWAAWIVIRRTQPIVVKRWVVTSIAGVALLGGLLGGRTIIENALTAHKLYPVQQVFLHDLTAISIQTGRNQLPLYVQQHRELTIPELQRIYTPDTIVHLLCCDNTIRRLNGVSSDQHIAMLGTHWLRTVWEHPGPYLRHRWITALQVFGWGREKVCLPYHVGIDQNDLGVVFRQTPLNIRVMERLDKWRDGLMFRGWVYLLLSLIGAAGALATWRRRRNVPFLVLTSSAVLYFVPYFFAATACDFRLLWWGVLAVVVSPLVTGMRDEGGIVSREP